MPYMSRMALSGLTLSAPDSMDAKVSYILFTSILGRGLVGWPSWGKFVRLLEGVGTDCPGVGTGASAAWVCLSWASGWLTTGKGVDDGGAVNWKPCVIFGCGGELAWFGGILRLTDRAWARAFCCLN